MNKINWIKMEKTLGWWAMDDTHVYFFSKEQLINQGAEHPSQINDPSGWDKDVIIFEHGEPIIPEVWR